MEKNKIDAVFVSCLPNITYLTNFSGFSSEDRDAFLLITKSNQYIFTHGIYKDIVKKQLSEFTLIEMTRENPTGKSLKQLITKHFINNLGYEATDLTVWEYERLFKSINKKRLTQVNLVERLRTIKNTDEIKDIKKSCLLGDKTYSQVLTRLRTGMTEKDIVFEIDYFIKKNGGETSFPSIVAFGENAAFIHHQSGDRKLKRNDCVLLDFGVKQNNYCSDMSRTFFYGKANRDQTKIYQTVFESQKKAIRYIEEKLEKKEAVKGNIADKISRDFITQEGYVAFPYSLGHGIGLEVHESPRLTPSYNEILENGMVFSIEPGIYLPDKMGVRIEDLFAIENNKLIPLTLSPKKLLEI